MTEQLTLPLLADPAPPRTKHAYRGGDRCSHCGVLRRFAATGVRLGRLMEWSHDGGVTWTRKPGPCVSKR